MQQIIFAKNAKKKRRTNLMPNKPPYITLPVRIEPSSVYHEIVDADDRLICFMGMSEVALKRAEIIVSALNIGTWETKRKEFESCQKA